MLSYLIPEGDRPKVLSFNYYKRVLTPTAVDEVPHPAEEILKAVGYSKVVTARHNVGYSAVIGEDGAELRVFGEHEAQVVLLSPLIQLLYSLTPGTNFKIMFNNKLIRVKTWIPIELTEEMVNKILENKDEEFLLDALRVKLVNPLLVAEEGRIHAISNTIVQLLNLSKKAGLSPRHVIEALFEDEDFRSVTPVKEIRYSSNAVRIILKDKRNVLVEIG